MAFSATLTDKSVFGNQRIMMGTFTQVSGDTGGTIATGLSRDVNFFTISCGMVSATTSGGSVTVVTANPGTNSNGWWLAIGY